MFFSNIIISSSTTLFFSGLNEWTPLVYYLSTTTITIEAVAARGFSCAVAGRLPKSSSHSIRFDKQTSFPYKVTILQHNKTRGLLPLTPPSSRSFLWSIKGNKIASSSLKLSSSLPRSISRHKETFPTITISVCEL